MSEEIPEHYILDCSRCGLVMTVHILQGDGAYAHPPHFCGHCGKPVDFSEEVSCATSACSQG